MVDRVSGFVERILAEEMKKVTAALNGISEHTIKIDEVTQRMVKMEKTTKNYQQASLQLAALMKEIEKSVKAMQQAAGGPGDGGKGANEMALSTCGKILPTLEGIRKRLDVQAEERVLTNKEEKDILLKIFAVVDEFKESGVICKNVAETKNLANDNTLLQIFNAFNELKNNVNQKETLNVKHCNEIKVEVAKVARGLQDVTKGQQKQDQASATVTNASPMFAAKHEKTLAKITATVDDIKRMAHGDTKTLSAMSTIIQGLKTSMTTHGDKVTALVKDLGKEHEAKVAGLVKELREQLDVGQLVEPIEETKTLLAEIHKGQDDALKDIRAASKGHEDTIREVRNAILNFSSNHQSVQACDLIRLTLFWLLHCLPDSAWTGGNLADFA